MRRFVGIPALLEQGSIRAVLRRLRPAPVQPLEIEKAGVCAGHEAHEVGRGQPDAGTFVFHERYSACLIRHGAELHLRGAHSGYLMPRYGGKYPYIALRSSTVGAGSSPAFSNTRVGPIHVEDLPLRVLSPSQIERRALREEGDGMVVEVIVHPPCKVPPVPAGRVVSGEPWNDDRAACAEVSLGVPAVPDVRGAVRLVRRAVEPVAGAEVVHLGGAIGRADLDRSEGLHKWFQQPLCEYSAGLDCKIRIFGNVADSFEGSDLRVEEVPHEEVARKLLAPQLLEGRNAAGSPTVTWPREGLIIHQNGSGHFG